MDELFQTVSENPEAVSAQISGTLPNWLSGTLLRNGPAKYEFGKHDYKHWFDGLALLHAFFIDNGEVVYRSKFIRSQAYVKGEEQNRIVYTEFGTAEVPDPCQSIFSRFLSYFSLPERTDNCAVNIFGMKGKLYANSDSPFMTEIDPNTLDGLDVLNVKTDLGSSSMVYALAHPHEDPDGNVYHVMSSVGRQPKYNIVQIPPATRANHVNKAEKPLSGAKVLASIRPHNQLAYYHSFGITPNYFIFVENPFTVNTLEILTMKIAQRSFHDCIHWDSKQPSRFYLVKRGTTSTVTMYEAHSFFTFHHVNAYENGDEVVVDVVCYPDASIVNQYYLYHLRSCKTDQVGEGFADGEIRRYRLKIPEKSNNGVTSSRLRYEILGSDLELPRINYSYNGLPYRYVYGTGPREHGHFMDQLIKLDTMTKEKKLWYEQNCYPSEPVFVAKPGGQEEDDGVILSAVVGTRGKKSFMVVLDASSFQELARATIPSRIPQSLHGNFLPSLNYKLESFHASSSKVPEI